MLNRPIETAKVSILNIFVLLIVLLPTTSWSRIETYFNRKNSSHYIDPYKKVSRFGDNLEAVILREINRSTTSIDLAVQEFRLPQIAKALKSKADRGIKVRVILENKYNFNVIEMRSQVISSSSSDSDAYEVSKYEELVSLVDANRDGRVDPKELKENDAIEILRGSKVKIIDDTSNGSKGSGLMHHKFIVIDGKTSVLTSANFTPSCIHGDLLNDNSRGNANAMMVVESQDLAKLFAEEFEEMWSLKFGIRKKFRPSQKVNVGGVNITVKFSPTSAAHPYEQSTNGLIAKELNGARSSIEAALFVFSEQQLSDALYENKNSPTVGMMVESKFAFRYYSGLLDLLGLEVLGPNCQEQAGNQPWPRSIEFGASAHIGNGDVLHHKFGVIDQRKIVFGSHNWSNSANRINDEFLVVVDSPSEAKKFSNEFRELKSFARKVPTSFRSNENCRR